MNNITVNTDNDVIIIVCVVSFISGVFGGTVDKAGVLDSMIGGHTGGASAMVVIHADDPSVVQDPTVASTSGTSGE
jgi:hypothetical protein